MATLAPTADVPRQQISPPGAREASKRKDGGGGSNKKLHPSSGSPLKKDNKGGVSNDENVRQDDAKGTGAGGCSRGAADTAGGPAGVEERFLPHPSPSAPPQPMCPADSACASATTGAIAASSSRAHPSSGILARSFSGNFSDELERAASLGDRYKGNSTFRQQQQQQQHGDGGSSRNHGNRVIRAGDRHGERHGRRRSLRGPAAAAGGRAGRGSGEGSHSSRMYAAAPGGAVGEDGPAAGWDGAEDGHGNAYMSGSRRRGNAVGARRGAGLGAEADEGVEGRGDEERQQSNGRVAQIAESVLWVQKHPVLAAVIWMCGKVLDPGVDSSQQQDGAQTTAAGGSSSLEGDDGRRQGLPHGCSRRDGDAGAVGSGSDNSDHEDGVEDSSDPGMGGGLWGGSCSNIEEGRVVPPGFWRRHSKGRLSWSDDYKGGCLAEYYEDERTRMASESSSVPPFETDAAAGAPAGAASATDAPDQGQLASFVSAQQLNSHSWRSRSHDSPGGGGMTAAAAAAARRATLPDTGTDREDCCASSSLSLHHRNPEVCARRGKTEGHCGGPGPPPGQENGRKKEDEEKEEENEEVFHSTLQLADLGDLEGIMGGCAARAHEGVIFGDIPDAMKRQQQTEGNTNNADSGVAPSRDESFSTSRSQDLDGCEDFLPHASAPAGGSAVPNTVAGDFDSAAGLSGNGTGTPNSSAGPGTWSPQWGWYVTMTPPQDQYPTEQNPMPDVKGSSAPISIEQASDTTTSGNGRPPRP